MRTPVPSPATRPLPAAEPAAAAPIAAATPAEPVAEAPIALGGADFDLAAELSGALAEGAGAPSASRARDGEGFEEVFAAFKAGVKREMGEGDFEAHYDLGIAYKEMGLHEDAIGELRLALGAPARRLGCLHLMAACALELGRGSDAVSHLSEALAGGALPAEQEAALRIDLGRAYLACGDRRRARAEYETVKRLAPGFGDVDRLIAELDAAPAIPRAGGEAFESFDDLLEEDAPAAAEPPPDSRYETFDELISEDAPAEPALAPKRQADPLPEAEEPDEEIALEDEVEPPPAAPPAPPAAPAQSRKAPVTPPPPAAPATPPSAGAPAAGPARRKRKISFV
jgi:tetratricopeptide (TPR) repeat protein